ncbi:MAG: rRNA maturation RNase YbeY [Bacteroidales bacterium]|nr:rRNA maturation RNase YbeY [Bacteroidales bacterium]
MAVKFFTEDISHNLKGKKKLISWIHNTIQEEELNSGDVNIILTSDKYLLQINKQYLNHDYYTDIITFNYCETNLINGDVFISLETVKNNSERFDVNFKVELSRVIIHGILHLIGFNDQNEDEKQIMREKENYYLDRLKNLS